MGYVLIDQEKEKYLQIHNFCKDFLINWVLTWFLACLTSASDTWAERKKNRGLSRWLIWIIKHN